MAFQQSTTLGTMRADGTGWRGLPKLTSGEATPTWSPSGRRLAFTGSTICCNWLYTVRTDGSGLRRVLARQALWPSWSVTGTIAFAGAGGLYTVRPDGSRLRRVTRAAGRPDWSPDGRRIVFSHANRIYAVSGEGRALRRLIVGDRIGAPAWSPDGKHIAFLRDGDLWVMRADGRAPRRLVDARQADPMHPTRPWAELSPPTWQPRRRADR